MKNLAYRYALSAYHRSEIRLMLTVFSAALSNFAKQPLRSEYLMTSS
jgi:hypothetical protein